jgi:hypothetical protein
MSKSCARCADSRASSTRKGMLTAAKMVRNAEKEYLMSWLQTRHPVYRTLNMTLHAVRYGILKEARQADRECACPTNTSR